jgi:hypothetical protein
MLPPPPINKALCQGEFWKSENMSEGTVDLENGGSTFLQNSTASNSIDHIPEDDKS